MNTPILQHLFKLIISLLLALVPFYTLLAQTAEKKEAPKTIKVKMLKSVDGKLIYAKDTVMNAEDHEKQIKALRNMEFDEKTWQKLDASKVKIDSISELAFTRIPAAVRYTTLQDTAALRKLKGVKMYKMDKALSEKDRAKLFEKMKGAAGDSFLIKTLKNERIMFLNGDSAKALHFKDGNITGRAFSIVHGTGADSAHVIVSVTGDNPIVVREGHFLDGEEITTRYSTSENIKIETDESGKTTVYELDEKGNKKVIDGYHFGKTGEKATVILLSRTKVEAITNEDKKALKEAGVKVEKSEKKELKIDNLSYYPNPSNGRFNVSFTLPDKKAATVRVLNSVGKQVYQEKVENPTTLFEKQIDLSGMEKGIYYLQIEQSGRTLTKRLLLQ